MIRVNSEEQIQRWDIAAGIAGAFAEGDAGTVPALPPAGSPEAPAGQKSEPDPATTRPDAAALHAKIKVQR